MKVAINQGRIPKLVADGQFSYQQQLELTCLCRKCKEQARLIMLIDDDEGLLASQRPEGVKIWPHDCTAIALYLCTQCGSMRAKWNQA